MVLCGLLLDIIMFVHLGVPSTPPPPKAGHVTCSLAMLTWQPPRHNGSPITSYTVRIQLAVSPTHSPAYQPWMEHHVIGTTNLTIDGLIPGARYYLGVAAQNAVGGGAFSDTQTFTTSLLGE